MPLKMMSIMKKSILTKSFLLLSKRDRFLVNIVVILQIIFALLDLVGVIIVGLIGSLAVSGVSGVKPGTKVYSLLSLLHIENQNIQFQATALGLTAAVFLSFKSLLTLLFNRKSAYFLSRRGALISRNLVLKLLGQNLLKINERSLIKTINIVTNGVTTITVGVLGTFVFLISDISLIFILGIGLFVVDTVIAISTLILFSSIAILLYRFLHQKVRLLGEKQNSLLIAGNEKISEVVTSFREIYVRDRRYYYANVIGDVRLALADTVAESSFLPNISKYAIEITLVFGALGIAGFQFITQPAGHAVAVLSIFIAASTRIAPAVLRVQQGLLSIKGAFGTAYPTIKLIEELAFSPSLDKTEDVVVFEHIGFEPTIKIENVTFKYPNSDRNALTNVSLSIEEGKSIAVVGPSGSGKTTLIDVMLGLLPIESGICLISGFIPNEAIKHWPGSISYVPQDIVINNGTIASNVAMGFEVSLLDEVKIWEALELAQLTEFVSALPKGIYTNVGNRGQNISGGQRQRLGIARALFTNPKLLIMDEATSSLDGATEASITESIHKLRGRVTVITIAHRLSTVRNCDEIVYIEQGKILAKGSFSDVRRLVPNFDKAAILMGLQ